MRWGTIWLISSLLATTVTASHFSPINTIDDDLFSNQDEITPAPQEIDTTKTDSNLNTISTDPLITTVDVEAISRSNEENFTLEEVISQSNETDELLTGTTDTVTEDSGDTLTTKNDVRPTDNGDDSGASDVSSDEYGGNSDSNSSGANATSEEIGGIEMIVETKSGPVQGYIWRGYYDIVSYIDIPYGQIVNPFQISTKAQDWQAVHEVDKHTKICPQLQGDAYVGDTDCLTLSIFKPLNAVNASVLFHIHGDQFNEGSGNPSIYGPGHLASKGIILVLPNYRLGPLGFLCMQNETAPGNMAMKDLSLALSWISENIAAFGGDPDNIAVSGDGRSGALAGLLALSPMSQRYVSKVIAESGSFLSYWALDRDPTVTANILLEKLRDQSAQATRNNIKRLEDFSMSAIVTAAKDLDFRPCVETNSENAFIPNTPFTMITREYLDIINATSFLIGSATYAGALEALMETEESIKNLNEDYTQLLPSDLSFQTETSKNEVGEKVKTQYFGSEAINATDVQRLSLCYTDIGYLGPGIRSARLLVNAGATVFFYEFAYVGEFNKALASLDHVVEGAVRGDIVGYLFTQNETSGTEQATSDQKIVDTLTQMWTNFLKTGNPSTDTITWNKLENTDHLNEEWFLIDSEPSMKQGLHVERLQLWTEIYNNYYIDGNHGNEISPSVYTILVLQFVFWLGVYSNANHLY